MRTFLFLLIFLLASCNSNKPEKKQEKAKPKLVEMPTVYTKYSEHDHRYVNFESNTAINKIADIENEYFRNSPDSISRYYGTVWRENAEKIFTEDSSSVYEMYLKTLPKEILKPDSLHCTIYAYEGLKAGLTSEQLKQLEGHHKEYWGSREIAGWSIGFLLHKYFNWDAYLIIDTSSFEYDHCLKAYKKNKSYPVWKQPDIPLKDLLVIGQQDSLINQLLKQNEFAWGFSRQGIHTWICRFDELKECNWLGAPSQNDLFSNGDKPLFISTPFQEYHDYLSHVLLFPPTEPIGSLNTPYPILKNYLKINVIMG